MDKQFPTFPQQVDHSVWEKMSPRGLEHRVRIPTAITFHRLVPKAPRTPKSHHKLASYSYKHLDPEEIARAQAKARVALLRARLSKDEGVDPVPQTSHNDDKTDAHEGEERRENIKKGLKNEKQVKRSPKSHEAPKHKKSPKHTKSPKDDPSSRPKLPVYRGIGETNLRSRQITKLLSMIADCLQDLDSIPQKSIPQKDFVFPSETEIMHKRWNEFMHSSGRMLFTLKREVGSLERSAKYEEKNNKFYRMLASCTRTLYRLLQALKTYSEVAFDTPHGKKLHSELLIVCQKLFAIASSVGIPQPKTKLKIPLRIVESETEDSSVDSSELVMSDVPPRDLNILQPDYVRSKLFEIAKKELQKKRRKKQRDNKPSSKIREGKKKTEIILSPLKRDGKSEAANHQDSNILGTKTTKPSKKSGSPSHKVKFGITPERRRKPSGEATSGTSCSLPWENPRFSFSQAEEKPSSGKQELPHQLDPVCKLQDHNKIVEETADAVVNRLLPLLALDHEEKISKESKEIKEGIEYSPRKAFPAEDINRQLQFMFERVCKIEEEREQSKDVVIEISRRIKKEVSFPENTLQTAIDQAKYVLQNLSQKEKPIMLYDTHVRLPTSTNILKPNLNLEDMKLKRRVERSESDVSYKLSETDKQKDGLFIKDELLSTVNNYSVADQLRLQREEFWASLVQKGFVKPLDVNKDGKIVAEEAVELLLKGLTENVSAKNMGTTDIPEHYGVREGVKAATSTNVKRDKTLAKVNKEDKGTLVTSLMSSSISFESEEKSNTRSKLPEDTNASDEKSSFQSSQTQSEVASSTDVSESEQIDSSKSVSFPSYDGRSVSEKL